MIEEAVREYKEAVFDTDQERALKVVHDALDRGATPEDVVFKIVLPAMDGMIKSMNEGGGASLAQHFMTAHISDAVTAEMVARFQEAPVPAGRVVIGTASGDLHTLGKRIVTGCLKARMMHVFDLGVDVAPETFVDEAEARAADVIGISSMMMHTARGARGPLGVREILHERGLEDRIQIIVGGAPYRYDPELWRIVGADAFAEDGVTAGKVIAGLIAGVHS